MDDTVEKVDINLPAPDFRLTDISGKHHSIVDFKDNNKVVLFFMRAFSCMQCREFVRRLALAADGLVEFNAKIIVIGPGSKSEAERLQKQHDPNNKLIILYDGTGDVYTKYTLNKVFFSLIQKSAIFVVDRSSTIRYAQATGNANRWIVGNTLDVIREQLSTLQELYKRQTGTLTPPQNIL
jgi:peroxiredoxin